MGDWRLDQVGRQFDEEARPAPLTAGGDAGERAPGGRPRPGRDAARRSGIPWAWLLLATLFVGAASGFGIWYLVLSPTPLQSVEPVLINADRSPTRIAPEDPGGMEVPHQERLVLQDRADEGPPGEAAARPEPEQPMPLARADLAQPEGEETGAEPPVAEEDPVGDLIAEMDRAGDGAGDGAGMADNAGSDTGAAEPETATPETTTEEAARDDNGSPSPVDEAGTTDPRLPEETTGDATPTADESATPPDDAGRAGPMAMTADGEDAPVEVLMPRLPEEADVPTGPSGETAAADEAAEEPVDVAGLDPGPVDPDSVTVEAEPAEPVLPSAETPRRPPGPLTASILGREPESIEAGGADDPFVDLLTALSWPSDRTRDLRRTPPAPAPVPIGGSPVDTPARSLEVAALTGAVPPAPAMPEEDAAAPEPEAAEPPGAPDAPDAAARQFAPQAGGGYRVQIVAVQARADAASEWARISRAHADLLGAFEPYVQEVDLGERGIWYRVQAGPLDRADADALCAALQDRDAGCIVRSR
jgi:hypothetical protein